MNTSSLQAVQAKLNERGVRDVKFFFNQETSPLSDMKERVAYVLDTYLRGDCEQAQPAGDTKIIAQ